MSELYTYAAARIHAKESSLLTEQDLERLLACKSDAELVAVLNDKGIECTENESVDDIVEREREKTRRLISEAVGDMSDFEIFFIENDFQNLKAAVKSVTAGSGAGKIFVGSGTVPRDAIESAVKERNFGRLPREMTETAENAVRALLETGDGGLCDILIDKAYLESVKARGEKSDSPMIRKYAELYTALANLRIAARGVKLGKNREFFNKSLAKCETLDISSLATAAAKGEGELEEYISCTDYSAAIEPMSESSTALEKWCDDRLMEEIRKERFNNFTIAPLAAYYLGRESELKAVGLIMTAKRNRLDVGIIRERLRMLYV